VTAWLRRARWQHLLTIANQNALALYLWHMVPVVVVALACYPAALMPQPNLGSAAWWLWRVAWVAVLTAVTTIELILLWSGRSLFARPSASVAVRLPLSWRYPLHVAGTIGAIVALLRFAAHGFAPSGYFPVTSALIYVAGVVLVSLNPVGTDRSPVAPKRLRRPWSFVEGHSSPDG
jgi:hypothetical protein